MKFNELTGMDTADLWALRGDLLHLLQSKCEAKKRELERRLRALAELSAASGYSRGPHSKA